MVTASTGLHQCGDRDPRGDKYTAGNQHAAGPEDRWNASAETYRWVSSKLASARLRDCACLGINRAEEVSLDIVFSVVKGTVGLSPDLVADLEYVLTSAAHAELPLRVGFARLPHGSRGPELGPQMKLATSAEHPIGSSSEAAAGRLDADRRHGGTCPLVIRAL